MATNSELQLDEMSEINKNLQRLSGLLEAADSEREKIQGDVNRAKEDLGHYREEAAQLSKKVEDQQSNLSSTIAKINEFFDESENILKRVEKIERSLDDYAKPSDFDELRRKVRDISEDLNSTSTKLSEYVQRSELEREIDRLREELDERKRREIEFQKKINELEKKKKTDTATDKRIRALEEKIAEFEKAQTERVSQIPIPGIKQQSNGEASVQASVLGSDDVDSVDNKKDQHEDGITLAALNGIISRSSELKQKILSESITGLNTILERHGIQ